MFKVGDLLKFKKQYIASEIYKVIEITPVGYVIKGTKNKGILKPKFKRAIQIFEYA